MARRKSVLSRTSRDVAGWLDAPPEVLVRVQHRDCDAGHMMYTRQADPKPLTIWRPGWAEGSVAFRTLR
jgi:hypothetical protein